MASSPESQPETPPASVFESSLVEGPPIESSPPPQNTSSPPPVAASPPPPISASPPPTTPSPPPVTPSSPPPTLSPPPSSPNVASPPPSPVTTLPPPVSLSPPPEPTFTTFSIPSIDLLPPSTNFRVPTPPTSVISGQVFPDSPPVSSSSSTTSLFNSPPSIDNSSTSSSSSPVPSGSSTPPQTSSSNTSTSSTTSTNTSTSSGSSPRNPLKTGGSGSHAGVSTKAPPNTLSSSSSSGDHAVGRGIAIGVVATIVMVGLMLVVLFIQRRRKRRGQYNPVYVMPSPYNSSQASGSSLIKGNGGGGGGGDFICTTPDNAGLGNSKSWFTYEELAAATNGFSSQNILGAGGFGCVYKGMLQDGREVAVKKLKDNSGQGDREFKAEVEIISRVHHRYLVSLVGYCITDQQRLLVYEFVPNGTLHYHLHSSSKPPMEWPLRVKVACGSARGIAYLHEDCQPKIIHRDIKSPNILIDNNFEAKVADFGLAKLARDLESNTHISTRVMGTFGYMAPEYASSGKLTEKSDVFSFGVVLLEIITGRKPVDESRPLGDESLVEWARPLMTEALEHGNFDELADPRLQGNYDQGEMFRLIEAAAACVRHSALKRPKMSQVVRALDTINEISDLSNGIKPGQSGIYDSREQSAQIQLFQRMAFGNEEFDSGNSNNNGKGGWTSSQVGGRSGLV